MGVKYNMDNFIFYGEIYDKKIICFFDMCIFGNTALRVQLFR